jgi:dTDP-4-dehydrorhamnose reductase
MSTKKIPESLQKIDTKDDDDNNKEQLWHIIEKQRTVIYELQKALFEITKERDQLLEKLHEENTIPTPPPRSPYRSTMSENSYTHIEIPPKTNNNKLHQQRKSMSDLLLHGDEQEKVKQLPGITKVIQILFTCVSKLILS